MTCIKKILIVDDEPYNIFALSEVLQAQGFDVFTVQTGIDALSILESNKEIDLVLLDIMMPDMDGFETLNRIRKNTNNNNIPVFALTAKAMKGDREKCLKAGADEYVSKPVDIDELLKTINNYPVRN